MTSDNSSIGSNRSAPYSRSKHNGQRWRALAVQDYESRALPLSDGGAFALLPLFSPSCEGSSFPLQRWGCWKPRNSAWNSANAGVVSRRWPMRAARKSLKTQRPALASAGRVRLEGCCSIHLSYGRAMPNLMLPCPAAQGGELLPKHLLVLLLLPG
jgi:hypothetical protein